MIVRTSGAKMSQERAPALIVGSVPTGLGGVSAGLKALETTLDIDAGAVDIVQERAPILNVGLAVTELKDLDSYATSC